MDARNPCIEVLRLVEFAPGSSTEDEWEAVPMDIRGGDPDHTVRGDFGNFPRLSSGGELVHTGMNTGPVRSSCSQAQPSPSRSKVRMLMP